VLPPTYIARVSDHISEIVAFIEKIAERGFAYKTVSGKEGFSDFPLREKCRKCFFFPSGSVYFDTAAYKASGFSYGKFVTSTNSGSPSTTEEKRSPEDFVLWKAVKPNEPFWDSNFGKGRPGWHIECSAMARSVFNFQTFKFIQT
jgi:cysteinyl-tRNA synthetase